MTVLGDALAFVIGNTSPGPLLESSINFNLTGDNQTIPGVAGQAIYVYKYFFVVAGATNITFKDGANTLTGPVPLAANEAMVFTFDTRPWFSTTAGNAFIISQSGSTQISGRVYYLQK